MELLIILALVLLNGLFSMAELAVISARRIRLQSDADRGDRRAGEVLALVDSPTNFLATVQVGITSIGIIAGVYGGARISRELAELLSPLPVLGRFSSVLAYGVVIGLIAFLSLVVGELVPKRIALAYPEQIAKCVAKPLKGISWISQPLIWVLDRSTEWLVRPLRLPSPNEENLSEEDIRSVVIQGSESGVIEEEEGEIIHRVFRLGDRSVASLMTPRNQVVSLRVDAPWERNVEAAMESRRSWFPVVGESPDQILGVVSVHDVLEIDQKTGATSAQLMEMLSAPVRIPESTKALRLLELFRRDRARFAIVFDEYGGFAGVATVHDVVETIVGELGDSSEELPSVHHREDGSLLVDASMDINELWRLLEIADHTAFEDGAFHSLGGFIMTHLGRVPREGDIVSSDGYRFEVIDMDHFRIDKVLISRTDTGQADADEVAATAETTEQ